MDGETTMSGNGRLRTKIPDVASSVSGLTNDIMELSELQAKLFVLDVKKSSRKTRMCLILAVVGACLVLGTIPVVLAALAQLFVEQLGWSQAAAFGVAALIGVALAATVLGAAWGIMKSGLISLERSRDELSRNLECIKTVLRTRGEGSGADKPVRS
jgi:hypothetical protein